MSAAGPEISLTLPSSPRSLEIARKALRQAARLCAISDEEFADITLVNPLFSPGERESMKVARRTVKDAAVLDVSGDVDMASSPELRAELSPLTRAQEKRIVVNLADVEFMDSSGIATLVISLKEAKRYGGDFRLASPGGNVLRVLKLSNLTSLFKICDTVEEAAG